MTDETMKDLVTKHDMTITQLVTSVEHLVQSQTETNKRLEEISKFLAKQAVFSNKLELMDKELGESFKRVHKRIDEIDTIQKADAGCNATKLLNKDVGSITKEMNRLILICKEHRLNIESLERHKASQISPTTIKWAAGLFIPFFIIFSVYLVQSINTIENRVITLSEHIKGIEK